MRLGLRRWRRASLLICAPFCQVLGQPQGPRSTASIASSAVPATVTVIALGSSGDTLGQGSGFFIRADGVVVTNWHVLAGASAALIVTAARERYSRVTVLDADSATDVAILKIPGFGLPILAARGSIPNVGQRVIAIGSPLGLSQTVSEGIVSATRVSDGRMLVQISAPISPGSSGGPVLDDEGRVFAISTLSLEGGQQLNFAVPMRYVLGLLAEARGSRAVHTVFSTGSGTPVAPPQPRSGGAATEVRKASNPKSSLSGTYYVVQRATNAPNTNLTQQGVLLAGNEIGLLVLALMRDSAVTGPPSVYVISSFRTNPEGFVVLEAGGVTYDGFQTDDGGFSLRGTILFSQGPLPVQLSATPYSLPLSWQTGLYTARGRAFFQSGGVRSDLADWSGDLAIATKPDSISLVLKLRNSVGGSIGFSGTTRLSSERTFRLETKGTLGKVVISGSIRAGVVDATWMDQRGKDMYYEGSLRAERR